MNFSQLGKLVSNTEEKTWFRVAVTRGNFCKSTTVGIAAGGGLRTLEADVSDLHSRFGLELKTEIRMGCEF